MIHEIIDQEPINLDSDAEVEDALLAKTVKAKKDEALAEVSQRKQEAPLAEASDVKMDAALAEESVGKNDDKGIGEKSIGPALAPTPAHLLETFNEVLQA